jgi:hypothetical protein
MRAATTTHESELARLRSVALVSQQTIDSLRKQIETTVLRIMGVRHDQVKKACSHRHTSPTILWHPWVHHLGDGLTLHSVVTIRDPRNYSLPGRDLTPETPRADPLRAIYGNEGGSQGPSNQSVASSSSTYAYVRGLPAFAGCRYSSV